MGEEQPRVTARRNWFQELAEAALPALIIVLVVNIFLAQATRVDGQSMIPSLQDNQRIIIEKISYRFRAPERGDIIVLNRPQRAAVPLIKRVIGLPGDTIAIHDGRVYVNGDALNEPYLAEETRGVMPSQLVPEGHVFVLGDNRGSSNDSRAFGMVSFSDIIGRAWVRYWPLDMMTVFHGS
ncbi:MAG: signal peptidase I [Anaerolineae bacterium]